MISVEPQSLRMTKVSSRVLSCRSFYLPLKKYCPEIIGKKLPTRLGFQSTDKLLETVEF